MVISSKVVKVKDFIKENPANLDPDQLDGIINLTGNETARTTPASSSRKAQPPKTLLGDLSVPHYATPPKPLEPPSGVPPLLSTILLGFLLAVFYLWLEYYAHQQYRIDYDLNDAFIHFWYPAFPLCVIVLWIAGQVGKVEVAGYRVFQVAFVALESWAGGELIILTKSLVTFGETLRVPGLGVLWAALTIQADLIPAAMGLIGAMAYYWAFLDATKLR